MAYFSSIHQAIARLQAVSASQLQLEPICIGPFRPPFERKLQAFVHFKRSELSFLSAVRSGLFVFATHSQDTATPTLVLQEVDFVWKGTGSQVLITGDFLGWDRKLLLEKGTDGAFHCKQKLSPGTYMYKYIVDGEWTHSPDSPTIEDGQGGYNNQVTVTDELPASTNLPTKESLPIKRAGVKDMAEVAPTAQAVTAEAAPKVATPPKAAQADTAEAAPNAVAPPKAAQADTAEAVPNAVAPPKAAQADTAEAVPNAVAPPKAAQADTAEAAPKSAAPPKAAQADTAEAVLKAVAPPKEAQAETAEAAPKAAAPPKAAPAARPVKKVEKPYPQMIIEDVIPRVKSQLQKEGVSDVDLVFQDNQLEGSFLKNGIIYTFWAFFPDGKLEGARGFSVSSHGSPPSTVEPFLIDEKKITADLLVFWVLKRLAAQRIISSG